ncbi:Canalicular multispecific organic anion transporter 2, variant 2 [Trifolium repens]|nr:Canalicular multispecific organic anion transporter 2, variant 2 [Trifolium repens]
MIDIVVLYENHIIELRVQCLVSVVVSFCVGLLFCYVGYCVKNESEEGDNRTLQEPLLNDNGNGLELKETKGSDTVTPYSNAGILSLLTLSWVSPLIAFGNKKTLDLEDVPQLDSRDSAAGAFPIFRDKVEADCGAINRVTRLKLVKTLIIFVWKEILITGFLVLIKTCASYVGPYLIDSFVQYLSGKRLYENQGYALVSAFIFSQLVRSLSQKHWFFKLEELGVRIQAVLVTMIYEKALTLSCQSRQCHSSGDITNLITVDVERVGLFSYYLHDFWIVALEVTLALLILYKNIGLASIAALVTTIIIMLANLPLGSLQGKFQKKLMESKDTRMKSTSETLRNMRILKLQGWEMKFLSKITELRDAEQGWLKKFLYSSAMTKFFYYGASTFVSVVTFGTCMLIGIPLESGKILSAIATFKILQGPIYNLPDFISMIAKTKVSLDRIVSFLRLDDLQSDVVEKLPPGSSDTSIEVVYGNFSWDLSSPNPTLQNINLKVFHGMKVAVCGTVGSGKSTLLSCVLGEVPKISGILKVCGTKAYVAQSPWIQSGKIEDNILFGEQMVRERYEKVLKACSLKKDLEILSFGDQTVIGERGINLSGGQKQRIQIARALYRDAEIYLFDDPFSAVDAHTGSHLFKECLLGVLRSKTVVYVTHQVEFLPTADLILVMKDGKITQSGKYDELLNIGTDFMELVGAHREALSTLESLDGGKASNEISTLEQEVNYISGTHEEANKEVQVDDKGEPKGQIVQEEEREKGKVGFSVYWKYITTAYGGAFVPFILLAQILYQALQIGSNYWMVWETPTSADVKRPVEGTTLIEVYVVLAIGSSLCMLVMELLLVTVGYKTATILFNKMHLCIFRAPMSFFDSTPSGRILNRASTDQSAVDTDIPYEIGSFAFNVITLLGIIAVMSQLAWQVFIVFVPVIALSIWYQQYYLPAGRELSRLVGVSRAPIIQHFAETISGTSTIRSFNQQSRFLETNMKLVDRYSRPQFNMEVAIEWLGLRLDVLSTITFAFSLILLISIPPGIINPGIAGLAVTYGLSINAIQYRVIWSICSLENNIISVERILQHTTIRSEPPLVLEENRPDPSWPSYGKVDIRNLQVRYAPHLPLVLHGLTCTFHGGLKTGIVGRTGSGKTTLMQTLFRLVEPTAGEVIIDRINISTIGLHDLRSRLSIIPQDPTMFEGTVRSNLDPLEEYTDEQIWEALDKCQLGDEVRKKEGKLNSSVTENSENWSMGQRQLVCLGRVLLKKSKILVLDEATASVDTATDNLIQQTLRQHFTDSTVITIAHRITSVLDSDMVLLLSQGLIEEYDSPTTLLEDKSSSFAKLVAEYTMRSNSKF